MTFSQTTSLLVMNRIAPEVCISLKYCLKLDHCTMQFKNFQWPRHREMTIANTVRQSIISYLTRARGKKLLNVGLISVRILTLAML